MVARKIPTVPQRALANALERRREAAGLSREDVNSALEWSSMKLYRIETARVTVSPGDIRELALLYQLADAETEALVALARQAKRPGWWKGMSGSLPAGFSVHLELESAAQAIRSYEVQFAPGLWQTEDYARAVLSARSATSTPEQIERQVTIRMRRHQILDRTSPPPPEIWAVLDEAVIRRVVGGRDVMRAQLARLRDISENTIVTLQVLPFSAGAHMAAYGSFSLFDPSDPAFPVTASTDRPGGTLIEDDPSDISQYTVIFDHLRATSLNPAESRSLIGEAMRLL
jgi:transcriptional regulator with XRE-family HTH domain